MVVSYHITKMTTIIERLLDRDLTLLDGYTTEMTMTVGPEAGTTSATQRELDNIDMDNPMSLYLIISAIQQVQFTEAVPWVLDKLLSQSADSDSYCDPEARLFIHAEIPIEMMTFMADSAPSRFSLAATIDSLISLDSTDEVFDACGRAVRVLGDTDYPSWVSFANEADVQGNGMVWLFCSYQARRVAPFAPKPRYMREFTSESLNTTPLFDYTEDTDIALLAKKRANDPELFRVWGPSNIQFDASDDEIIDGSADHRMFTDDRFTPEEQGTWFTGSCDQCWLRIKSVRYAVRKPIDSGGWRGQYCSWDCARIACEDYELPSYEMTLFYEKQCNEFGIYDHLFSDRGATLGDRAQPDDMTAPIERVILP